MMCGALRTGDLEPVLGLNPNPLLASYIYSYIGGSGLREDQGG